ncbi:MAG TPA: hypothetical protein VLS49_04750 [Usitatibacter sp.]|nr:hypothetical protein [Usitatibacter sp.]
MNLRILAFFAALVVFVAAAYLELKPSSPADVAPEKAAAGRGAEKAQLAPRSRLAARPAAAPAPFVRAATAPQRSSLYNEYANAHSYRELYDRLRNSPQGSTAEGLYVQYDILRKCATVTDRPWRRRGQSKPAEERREAFLKALPESDPLREKRIAAFEKTAVDRCAGFEDVKLEQADLDKLLGAAADAGDPKARAATVEHEIWQARRAGQWRTATLSDSQISTLEQAIGTKDPEAMMLAGRLLSNTWPDLTLRVGPAGQAVEPRAFYNAWQILACEYGYACGADNPRLLDECAYNAHCDAQSLPEYLYYYASSPHESELLARYESVLRGAIENGDWSQVVVSRGPRMPNSGNYVFRHGPG